MSSTLPHRFRLATLDDWDALWPTWHELALAQETYTYEPGTPYDVARSIWLPGGAKQTWVCLDGDEVLGSYQLGPNQAGPGAHVANASFIGLVRGRGVGRAMGLHALAQARERGFTAMQFNAVVSSNEVAVHLWQSLGFAGVGRVPGAYRRRDGTLADLLVMHRNL